MILTLSLFVSFGTSVADGTHDAAAEVMTKKTTTTTGPGPTQEEVDRWNLAVWNYTVWVNKTNERIWIEKTNERLAAEAAAEKERQEEVARAAAAAAAATTTTAPAANPVGGSGRCGGNLPPCCVMQRESGGNITAQNPTSSASGKWQFINGTWNNYMGYPTAASAPEWVQDQKAAELWAGGAGASHWGGGC